jgi:2-amino-4-hydroxy-6-hydroxymethyldihydropteridine diphosphokinase
MTEQRKSRVFLGFGGNIGDPIHHFRCARQQLSAHPHISIVGNSPIYRTPAVGGPAGQPDYLNGVVEILTDMAPHKLLQLCRQIEDGAGRNRDIHWGPRTLDIDLLLIDDLIVDDPLLTIPHPRLHQRHFVLLPLNDLAPHRHHPQTNTTIAELLANLPPATGISKLNEKWSSND